MQISERGIALLKQSEGFSATPYLCPAGKATIGYGHVITAGETYPPEGIDEACAQALLVQDVSTTEQGVNACVRIDLNQNQFDALVVLSYNIGIGAFEHSTLLKYLNQNNLQAALEQWGHWVYAAGKPLDGLKNRRDAEMALFLGS